MNDSIEYNRWWIEILYTPVLEYPYEWKLTSMDNLGVHQDPSSHQMFEVALQRAKEAVVQLNNIIIWNNMIILLWISCTLLCYGLMFAMNQKHYPSIAKEGYKTDIIFLLIMSTIGGPIILISALLFLVREFGPLKMFQYGLKFW